MKISCSTKILEKTGAKNIFDAIDLAANFGFDGINIYSDNSTLFSFDNFSFAKSAEIVRYALARKIEIQSLSIPEISADNSEIDRLNKAVSIAYSLACPLITFPLVKVDEKAGIVNQYKNITNVLKEASHLAADLDICLAVEPARDTITDTFEKVLQLFIDVDEYNFGVVINSISFDKNIADAIARDVSLVGESLLLVKISGDEKFDDFLSVLKNNDYKNYICLSRDDLNDEKQIKEFVNLIKNNYD